MEKRGCFPFLCLNLSGFPSALLLSFPFKEIFLVGLSVCPCPCGDAGMIDVPCFVLPVVSQTRPSLYSMFKFLNLLFIYFKLSPKVIYLQKIKEIQSKKWTNFQNGIVTLKEFVNIVVSQGIF